MRFTFEIETDNAAFEGPGLALETARLLEAAARKVRDGYEQGRARDVNGNAVGTWGFTS